MWKDSYRDDGNDYVRDIIKQDPEPHPVYEVDFDFDGKRFYCYINADDGEEALGIFFMNHDNVTFHNVLNCYEV